MLLDGYTIIIQIVNFLILLWLLQRFLYGPITRAIQAREEKIASTLDRAQKAEDAAAQNAAALENEKRELQSEKEQLLDQARNEITRWREKEIEAVKDEIENRRRRWAQIVENEQQAFLENLKTEVTQQVMRISEKVIADLADQKLEHWIITVFFKKMGGSDPEMEYYSGAVHIVSGFELTPESKADIRRKLSNRFPSASSFEFAVSPSPGMGIEVRAGDRKTAWTLNHYLAELEKEILLTLKSNI